MSRITTTILVFMLLTNASVGVYEASGLAEDVGVHLSPGISQQMDKLVSEMKNGFSPEAGTGETLFSLFVSAGLFFETIATSVIALPDMFIQLGFPGWAVIPFFTPMYMISALEIIFLVTGRDLV